MDKNKFFDFEMLFYIAIIAICLPIIIWANNYTKTRCEKAGGQLVEYTTKIGNACIYPPAKGK
jgi:hypothetical protein